NGLSGSVRQRDRGTDHLVGVTRIHTKTGRTLDGLVELGERDLTEQFAGFVETVTLLTVDFLEGFFEFLSHLVLLGCERVSPPPIHERGRQSTTSMPIERAVPAIDCAAASTSKAFMSLSLY